jgi:hypothetical protein
LPITLPFTQESKEHTVWLKEEKLKQITPLPHPDFYKLMSHLAVTFWYDRLYEGLGYCFDLVCRDEFYWESQFFQAWGHLSTLLSKMQCGDHLVEACLEKMRKASVPAYVSHQLICTRFEQISHANMRNTKQESDCFKKMDQLLPSCSRMLAQSWTTHVESKFRIIEDLLLVGQCTRDHHWNADFSAFPPTTLLLKIKRKIEKLEDILRLGRCRGFKVREEMDLLLMFSACREKLGNPNKKMLFTEIDIDNEIKYFVRVQTPHRRRPYTTKEYDVHMAESRQVLEKAAHRTHLEGWANVLVTHSLLFGLLGDDNSQQLKLMQQALDIFHKGGYFGRIPMLMQSIQAATRKEEDETPPPKKRFEHLPRIRMTPRPTEVNLVKTILTEEPRVAMNVLFGCKSAQKYYQ